jgi:hypothetical protein
VDLLALIKKQIESLPDGAHIAGLRSVLRHIDTAYKHLARGQSEGDDTAFTDAIYRANQAFEGSIKEAYRVLADKDPQKIRPYDIEKYLEVGKIFRDRILTLFTNYRTDWRNPSTHDYSLDFDEDEAFLAIISVSAFAKLLVDQIAEKLSFIATVSDVAQHGSGLGPAPEAANVLDRAATLFHNFTSHYARQNSSVPIESEAQLMGALSGFLSSVAPDLRVSTGRIVRTSKPNYIDMIVENDEDQVIVELKRGRSDNLVEQGMSQLMSYLSATGTKFGILFMYVAGTTDYVTERFDEPALEIEVRVIRPKR